MFDGLFEEIAGVEGEDNTSKVEDVRISRWPVSGCHFYVSVDGHHVEIDGKSKWNTIQAAEAAMAKYLRNKE